LVNEKIVRQFVESIWRSPFLFRLYSITLIALFAASIFIEKGQDVLFINGHYSLFEDQFFKSVTLLGEGVVFTMLLLITLFIRFQYAVICAVAWIGHGLFVTLFKRVLFPDVVRPRGYLDNHLLHFVRGIDVHSSHSFPSGHTATAFCAALLIALIFKNKIGGAIALVFACLVAYSRVYLLQHFLLDVTAGALIGCFTAALCWQFFNASQRPQWMNRRLRTSLKFSSRQSQVSSKA
jgi:membrane-associated phospholipid phosphatase